MVGDQYTPLVRAETSQRNGPSSEEKEEVVGYFLKIIPLVIDKSAYGLNETFMKTDAAVGGRRCLLKPKEEAVRTERFVKSARGLNGFLSLLCVQTHQC